MTLRRILQLPFSYINISNSCNHSRSMASPILTKSNQYLTFVKCNYHFISTICIIHEFYNFLYLALEVHA